MNHTPGPWTFDKEEDSYQYIKTPFYIRSNNGKYLIALGCLHATSTMPNARLIASAPELLEALEDLIADYEEIGGEDIYVDAYRKAKEAIAKAKE